MFENDYSFDGDFNDLLDNMGHENTFDLDLSDDDLLSLSSTDTDEIDMAF